MYSPIVMTILIIFFFIPSECYGNSQLSPIILVPDLGGSPIEARLEKPSRVRYICFKNTYTKYYLLWMELFQLFPLFIDCWVENIKLSYDSEFRSTFNQAGVATRVPGFGSTKTVEYLDWKLSLLGYGYLNKLVNGLLPLGYVRQQNLFAAPYDSRKGPSESYVYFENLAELVEKAYNNNNQSSVTIVGHGMGAMLTINFLQAKSQSWKNKYIRALISLAAPFGGTVKALKVLAAGENMGIFLFSSLKIKKVLSTMPSVAFLIPTKDLWRNEVLVSTANKTYNILNLKEFFYDIGNPVAWEMYINERKYAIDSTPPGVELHCFYGSGIRTLNRLVYSEGKFPENPAKEYEDGDGITNLRSMKFCENWGFEQNEKVITKTFNNTDHFDIIRKAEPLEFIVRTVKEL